MRMLSRAATRSCELDQGQQQPSQLLLLSSCHTPGRRAVTSPQQQHFSIVLELTKEVQHQLAAAGKRRSTHTAEQAGQRAGHSRPRFGFNGADWSACAPSCPGRRTPSATCPPAAHLPSAFALGENSLADRVLFRKDTPLPMWDCRLILGWCAPKGFRSSSSTNGS